MLRPASLKSVPLYPVTAAVGAAAIAVTGLWWSGQDIGRLMMDGSVWKNWELWRALTSTLPHVGIFHLLFNLYWVWVFGTFIEHIYGHWKTAGIFLLLAFGSALAEFSLFSGGVGLSGVGYGLWGMLWVLEQRDPRFAGAVDAQTSRLFVIWFFICVALTITGLMPVGNVAHGVGAIMGVLLGLAATRRGAVKLAGIAGLVALVLLGAAGSTVFWPWVNLSKNAEPVVEDAGAEALERGEDVKGKDLLELATRMRHPSANAWYNLGIAYERLGRYDDAVAAFEHAGQMPDATSDIQQTAREIRQRFKEKQRNR